MKGLTGSAGMDRERQRLPIFAGLIVSVISLVAAMGVWLSAPKSASGHSASVAIGIGIIAVVILMCVSLLVEATRTRNRARFSGLEEPIGATEAIHETNRAWSTSLLERPILSRNQDKLGRSKFAEAIADAIRSWRSRDSFVIGIYGTWGSGKTSVKNMVIEALETGPNAGEVDYLEFNPWQFSGQEKLMEAFFREVGIKLGQSSVDGQRLASKWRAYGAALAVGSSTISALRETTLIVAGIILILGAGTISTALGNRSLIWLLTFALLVVYLLRASGRVVASVSDWLEARAEANQKTVVQLRSEVSSLLLNRQNPLLIVIDDLDRLFPEEVRQLLQIVKANADLPNLVYMLLFQRNVVERNLERVGRVSGREFLEKIVQAGFDLPVVDRARVEEILADGIESILGTKFQRLFDQQRWGNLYYSGLRDYFRTLRDVYRFLPMLEFQASLFTTDTVSNVNPIDLVALEVLRIFEPALYQRLPQARAILVETPYRWEAKRKELEPQFADLLTLAPPDRRPRVREILVRLFPQIAWAFGGPAYGHDFWEEWYRELRVCSPDVFDRYFHFAIPSGDLPQAALERILSLVGDRPSLTRYLLELERQDLLEVAIDRLEAYKEEVGLDNAIPFVTSLFDIGDLLPRLGGRMLIDPATHAVRIIYFFLRREPNVERREEVLRTAILDTVGLFLPAMTVSWESNASAREKDSQTMLVRTEQLPSFHEIIVTKIRAAADKSVLASHPNLTYLLYRWRDWAGPEEPRGWVRKQLRTPKGVLTLLGAFTQEIHSSSLGDYIGHVQKRIPLAQLEEFIPLEDVTEQLNLMPLGNLTPDERQVIEIFEEARRRREQGKGDEFPS